MTSFRMASAGFVKDGAQQFIQEGSLGSAITVRSAAGVALTQMDYDGFGREIYAFAGADSDYRFVGGKGYVTDDSGMDMLGARYYIPAVGRFLTQDPIGQTGGMNLYCYCDNSPLTKTDALGHDLNDLWESARDAFKKHIARPFVGWVNAAHTTIGFLTGAGPKNNAFGPADWQTLDLKEGTIGHLIHMNVIEHAYLRDTPTLRKQSIGTFVAFVNTVMEPSNGTQAQVGGVVYDAYRRGNSVNIYVTNYITLYSLAYHFFELTKWQGWDRNDAYWTPMGTVKQTFSYSIGVPSFWRK